LPGRSLVPALAADAKIERSYVYWHHINNRAIRVGDWKLVRKGQEGPWELYDMKAGRTELHDLAAAQPEKASELSALWETWAARANVKSYPGNYDLENSPVKGKGKGKKK